jgi:hypothetical protein
MILIHACEFRSICTCAALTVRRRRHPAAAASARLSRPTSLRSLHHALPSHAVPPGAPPSIPAAATSNAGHARACATGTRCTARPRERQRRTTRAPSTGTAPACVRRVSFICSPRTDAAGAEGRRETHRLSARTSAYFARSNAACRLSWRPASRERRGCARSASCRVCSWIRSNDHRPGCASAGAASGGI